MMMHTGGYLIHKTELFRRGFNAHTSDLDNPVSPGALAAINSVQATPWRVNRFILDTLQAIWAEGIEIPGLPRPEDAPIPEKLPDSLWSSMSEDEQRVHKRDKARLYTDNARAVSKRDSLLRKIELAQTLRDEPSIWFPHAFDFRFRMYPIPQDLNPQGDDVSKALLMFAEGKRLGQAGYRWLQIQAANTYGQDKLSLEKRVEWTITHTLEIMQSAERPLDCLWWAEADEPFLCLAACRELYLAAGTESGLYDHVSHLPIQVDGSCNGLQHLSALGRDPIGAQATNVAANVERQDIYQRVADAASVIVAADVAKGVPEASLWAGNINRKTVKRAVMTTPYGVTNRGIRDQLVDDRITHEVVEDEGHQPAAEYLTQVIRQAMDSTISSASTIMGYLQAVAGAFAKAGVPFQWKTASGCTCQQAYYGLAGHRVKTLLGEMTLLSEDKNQALSASKARNGAAPNYIHSQDAAHMQLTINYARDVYGITAFSMIHDSYGTHAADMDNLSKALRRTFVDIYSEPVLEDFHRFQLDLAEPLGIELPVPPELGEFAVAECINSVFFFA